MESLPLYLNQTAAARILGVNRNIIRRAEERGQLRPIREGNEKLYSRTELLDLHMRRIDSKLSK